MASPKLKNVKDDIKGIVSQDVLASELSSALEGMFTIQHYKRVHEPRASYAALHCKPVRSIAEALLLDREVLALVANYEDIHVRSLQVARKLVAASGGRLDPALILIVHADRTGDERLRAWGREQGLKVIPIYRSLAGALPAAETLRRLLAQELFAMDPFSITGPVFNDMDFFGRGTDALELLRQLQRGRMRALFGIRKVGKTSLINRVVTLARSAGSPRIAMIDCSLDEFNALPAAGALQAVAKAVRLAAHQGYAHVSEALRRNDQDLGPVLDDLWQQDRAHALAIIFDEVDYITPSSPTRLHWRRDFAAFWRELRVVYQEAHRQSAPLAVLVSGVSSSAFRSESIDGVENAVLHFVPEDYLTPFAREASVAMIADLGRRCGLVFEGRSRHAIAETCGDFPYWIRMAGSYIHRAIEVPGRPVAVPHETVATLLEDFVSTDGAEVAKVALEDLGRKHTEAVAVLRQAWTGAPISLAAGRLAVRYGLAAQRHGTVCVASAMVREGVARLPEAGTGDSAERASSAHEGPLRLDEQEWAEELAVLNRRRNILERRLREFVRVVLKLSVSRGEAWSGRVLAALPERRRVELRAFGADVLLNKLYWRDLDAIVERDWALFEKTLRDKKRFHSAMALLNDRPDAHAKDVDAADVALYRRELSWVEELVA